MKFASALQSVAIACLVLACSPAVFAQNEKGGAWSTLPDFSATEMRGKMKWKIYHSGSKLRVDASPASAAIYAPEEDKIYDLLILPAGTSCVVMKSAQSHTMKGPLQVVYVPNTTIKPTAAKEVVDGHTCTVLEGVTTLPSGGGTFKSKIWAADDLKGVPLRIGVYSGKGIVTATYQDVVVGPPDPALFTLPSKCTPLEKIYQVAPASAQLPGKQPTDQKAPDQKPQ